MQDLVYVAVLIAFFALSALFVVGCDRIIGSDEAALAADAARVPGARAGRGRGMRSGDLIGIVIAALVLAYLVFALLNPEKI